MLDQPAHEVREADQDMRVQYVATIEKEDHSMGRVSGTVNVSRELGGTVSLGSNWGIKSVEATVVK